MSPGAWAQDTLTHIAKTGELRLGHREASHPFSYKDPATGQVRGYSVDICTKIYEELKKELKRPDLRLTYVLVDGKNRLADLKNNVVDLECGTTTNTLERQKEVAFSHHIFIATTAFLVRKDSGIKTVDDLNGKRIAVERKTTNDGLLATNERTYHRKFIYVPVDSTAQGLDALTRREADAVFADDAGLWSPMTRLGKAMGDYQFLEKRLSVEPYSIGLRRQDPRFKELVDQVTRRLIQTGEMAALYKKWFHSDQGTLPMSVFMREALKRPSDVGVEQIAF
ncbi:MAG: amino acid ABC transporter substrate-binding protein [Acidovorax sp.]|jgi:glutamate/aspartate transport system substrate-binding protein|nr:amino acid ABC transporter substrate-binding protein [Acidovorax sp.]MBV7459435.1 amino acid ABC transporter substrate-binding protein [Acidovorax sp. sif0632]MBV7464460.1 amino acid ABC transporter substrate-binding protein [Acidovorax sp. sif0613]OGA86656.1 MAG: glutamine-binding protein [Burkholderiales bacterium GWA2_64_37]HCE94207.1 amino acid ABC transporter substrate-binding protein [Acidovorax sp.]